MTESIEQSVNSEDIGEQLAELGSEIAALIQGSPQQLVTGLTSRAFDFNNGTKLTVAYNLHISQANNERVHELGPEFIVNRETLTDVGHKQLLSRTTYRWAEHHPGDRSHQHLVDVDMRGPAKQEKRAGFTQEDVHTLREMLITAREIFVNG